jgi:membrane associated rhomboid family serine protease
MDWELVLAINVMMVSFLALLIGIVNRQLGNPSIQLLHALVLVTGAVALYVGYAHAGTLVTAILVVLILPPGLLMYASNRAAAMARYPSAARFAKLAAFVHPVPSLRSQASFLVALANPDVESSAKALEALLPAQSGQTRYSLAATIVRLRGRWDDVLSIVEGAGRNARGLQEFEVRALGELGRPDKMVAAYERCKSKLVGIPLRNVQLFVLAFCGQREAVALLRRPGKLPMHADFLDYWDAIAAFNAPGHREEGRAMLGKLAQQSELAVVRAAAGRYCNEMQGRPPPPPSDASLAAAAGVADRWREARAMRAVPLWKLPVTLSLLALNSLMFALEHWYGGVENPGALIYLGAMNPSLVVGAGEWWRLLAALFLHFGWLHFVVNMLALEVFGSTVERVFGSWRMLAIYVVGGLGSMAVVLATMKAGLSTAQLLVGASGAIMALFGAWTARLIVRWLRSRDVLDRRQALLMAVVVAMQCAVDLLVPRVSFTAHFSGFLIGFALGCLLGRRSAPLRSVTADLGGRQLQV